MKVCLKIFTFGHCWNMLARRFPQDLKTSKFLTCPEYVQISGESHKPLQAMYNNRQVRNLYGIFNQSTITPVIHHSPTYNRVMKRKYDLHDLFRDLLLRVSAVIGKTATRVMFKTSDPKPKRYTLTDRRLTELNGLNVSYFAPSIIISSNGGDRGGRGLALPHSTISLSPAA